MHTRKLTKCPSSSSPENRKYQSETNENEENSNERKGPEFKKPIFSNSVLYNINRSVGFSTQIHRSSISKFYETVIINQIKQFQVAETLYPFDRRVTAITWHPKYPHISVAGSKGGDLILHNCNQKDDKFISGVGAAGWIHGLKFSDKDFCIVYTASLVRKITEERFDVQKPSVLYSLPYCYDNWFACLDVSYSHKLLLSGDCYGNIYGVKTTGGLVILCLWKVNKLHASKISHCEFNVHDPNIFLTASVDHFVKLWDLRYIKEIQSKPVPLRAFPHVKGVNSACFSPSDGLSLLTTDQHSELRVYSSPGWSNTLVIKHPHRQYMHMTPVQAVWHPMEDIIIAGRYPDSNIQTDDDRTIDFYDGSNGELLYRIPSPTGNIASLNAMNITGDTLATSAGCNIVYLKCKNILKGVSSKHESDNESEDKNSGLDLKKTKKRTKSATKTLNTKVTKLSGKNKTL